MKRLAAIFTVVLALSLAAVVNATDISGELVDLWTGTDEDITATEFAEGLAQSIIDYVGAYTVTDAQVDGSLEADELVLVGDVDGTANANDLDEAAVEAELESVLDLADMQGAVTIGQGGTTETASTEDAVLVGASTTDWAPKVIPDCNSDVFTTQALQYDQGTNAFECLELSNQVISDETVTLTEREITNCAGEGIVCADNASGWTDVTVHAGGATSYLSADVTCAVSASYCTIWSVTPDTASRGVHLTGHIIIDTGSVTVAPQFRARSTDTGYTGLCTWTLHDAAGGTTTAPLYVNTEMASAPADTAGTTWGTVEPQLVKVECALLADASPGAIVIEWQLETGTTPTQTVLAGSYLVMSN